MKYTKPTKPTLTFSQNVWDKMWALTRDQINEVSGIGLMDEKDPSHVVELFILDQVNSATSTEIKQEALTSLIIELEKLGISSSRLSFWWHSHATMSVFFSGTDESQIERFSGDGLFWSVVTNRKGDITVRCDVRNPINITFEDCDFEVNWRRTDQTEWLTSVRESITTAAPVVRKGGKSARQIINEGQRSLSLVNAKGEVIDLDEDDDYADESPDIPQEIELMLSLAEDSNLLSADESDAIYGAVYLGENISVDRLQTFFVTRHTLLEDDPHGAEKSEEWPALTNIVPAKVINEVFRAKNAIAREESDAAVG